MASNPRRFHYLLLMLPVIILIAAAITIIAASAGTPIGANANTTTNTATAIVNAPYNLNNLNITPGSDPSQLNFSWATQKLLVGTDADTPIPEVQIAKASDAEGPAFPAAKAKTFYGASIESFVSAAPSEIPTVSTAGTVFGGFYQSKVTVSGLDNSTAYVYRVGDGTDAGWSSTYTFNTRDPRSYSFLATGDPQLGAKSFGAKTLTYDQAGWQDTVEKAASKFPNVSFLISLGDEVNNTSSQQTQDQEYSAYFSPSQLTSLPVATIDGNHDFSMGPYYGYHYNLPNQSTQYGASQWGNDGDYWFTYGNALFMVINSNTESIATHDVFIGQAIAANPKAKWRIVSFHHSVYSEASHVNDAEIQYRRLSYPAVFDKYKIDVVLQGHDHSYTRSFQMLGGLPQKNQTIAKGSVVNPTGTLYLTLDSGSGSKFYAFTVAEQAYSAFRWQQDVPTFSYVTVDDNKFSIVTYRTDNVSAIDQYSITK
ncbi:MAG: metallophosphoesterase family protein [Thermacetogeniaceae bacterium]